MKKFRELKSGHVDLGTLLSSRTYRDSNEFNCCIYCGNEVEACEVTEYEYIQGSHHKLSTVQCTCQHAKKELEIKSDFIAYVSELDKYVNSNWINKKWACNYDGGLVEVVCSEPLGNYISEHYAI